MKHCVYSLVDPRLPDVMMYVGRTSVNAHKRTRDHISQARFRLKNGKTLAPVMQWILNLQADGLEPHFRVIGEYDEDTAAKVEAHFIFNLPELLNDDRPQSLNGGKRPGSKDSPQGRANKKRASNQKDTMDAKIAANARYSVMWRQKQGYPRPELGVTEKPNLKHYLALRGKFPLEKGYVRTMRQWRHEMGFPEPDKWTRGGPNRKHKPAMSYGEWMQARGSKYEVSVAPAALAVGPLS